MENKPLDTMYPSVDAEHQASSVPGTDFVLHRNPGEPKRQFVSPITGPTFLPNLTESEQVATAQMPMIAQELAQDNLSALHTAIVPTVVEEKATNSIVGEQIWSLQTTAVSQFADVEDNNAIVLQTVSIRTVKKKRAKKKISTFFINILILLVSILFLGLLVIIIIMLPNPMYKAAVFLVFLIVLSSVVSLQVKLFYRARLQAFLTVTQMVPAVGKRSKSSRDKDMKHLTLIKQDTTAFLRAITRKDLKKDSH